MKILLLAPSFYSLTATLQTALEKMGGTVVHFDYRPRMARWMERANVQSYRLPFKLRRRWEDCYLRTANRAILQAAEAHRPGWVFIYNNEMLLPQTVERWKQEGKRIVFFLGDSPFYTPTNIYYLNLLFHADLVICPDSHWAHQLSVMGIANARHGYVTYNEQLYHPLPEVAPVEDFVFLGNSYVSAWGYKRALFLNSFARYRGRILGNSSWRRWFEYFPDLEGHFEQKPAFLPFEAANRLYNSARILPVDTNPGMQNGIHLRVFDAIAAGRLPVVEYSSDIPIVFAGAPLPVIHNYREIDATVRPFLRDPELVARTVARLRAHAREHLDPVAVLRHLLAGI